MRFDDATKVCEVGGLPATAQDCGMHTLTVCLRSPSLLGWTANAGRAFRQSAARLSGIATDDVQTVVVLGIPTRLLDGSMLDTFTVKEHSNHLMLLQQKAGQGGGLFYDGAHITKIYELEPATIVELRKELAKMRTEVGGGKDATELECQIKQLRREVEAADITPADEDSAARTVCELALRTLPSALSSV